MFKLPLFPLNTVLFPGMPLSLHIFEDRYKQMINECIEDHKPFGVVLISKGVEAFGPVAEPHPIGCTAQITQVQPLTHGRMNIVAIGQERFRIDSLEQDHPYLAGMVELMPFVTEKTDLIETVGNKLRPWVKRYLKVLAEAENLHFDFEQLPNDTLGLTNLAAFLLQLPAEEKQDLLSIPNSLDLVREVYELYRREVTLLEVLLSKPDLQDEPFSLN